MNLQQLNSKIHQASKSELVANLASFKIDIAKALNHAEESEAYYRNHTGRELYRKLHNFGLGAQISSIGDAHDSGFRPLTVNGIKSTLYDPSIDLNSSVLLAWYSASHSSTITKHPSNDKYGEITVWADKSGNSNDLTGNGNPTTVASTQNSLNVIDLDGDDFFLLENYSTPANGNLQAFIVCEITACNNNQDSILSMNAANKDWQISAGNSKQFRGILHFANQTPHGSTTVASNAGLKGYHMFCADLDKTDDGQYRLLVDGKVLPGTLVRTYSDKISSPVDFGVFRNRGENQFPQGFVAEVLLLNNTDNTVREKVEGYLAHKWGIESLLPGSHPYKASAPS
tara:strand:+ start:4232 stop:5257 length:1026 start_codon:yes stop_codon:yes gene_type:complete